VSLESEVFSDPSSGSEGRHLTWYRDVQRKAVLHQILIGWTGRAGSLLNLHLPIRKIPLARILEMNAITYICIKLKFGLLWVQKDTAKITCSPVKV
jgi:hypothetical protein